MLRHLLPSAGSRGASSPASAVLRGAPTPERPSRRASLPSLGGTSRASLVRSRRRAARRRRAWGLVFGPPTDLSRGDDQVSQVPGEPSAYMPCSPTPARSRCPASSAPRCSLPLCQQRRLSQPGSYGARSHGLHAPCVRFAAGITPAPRNTRFRRVANLCRAGLGTRRVPRRFQPSRTIHGVLLLQVFLAH
jgi:hypothetical protein